MNTQNYNGKLIFFKDFFSQDIISGITLKNLGDFNATTQKDEQKRNKALGRIKKFQNLLGVNYFFLPFPEQKDKCWFVKPGGKRPQIKKCDALFLKTGVFPERSKIALGFTTGDCPIIIGSDGGNFFLIHSGLYGTNLGIGGKLLKKFSSQGLNLEKTKIIIWGGICPRCYEIGEEWKNVFSRLMENNRLDLASIIELQLLEIGVRNSNLTIFRKCSYESKDLFSFRAGEMERNLIFLKTIT